MRKMWLMAVFFSGLHWSACAGEVLVAVASNFSAPMQKIAQAFARETGHKALLSIGSTGNLYAQIRNGAPYQVLLAADEETPDKLEAEGLAVAGSRFTYATGTLVLWSKQPGLVEEKGEVLRSGKFERIAMANPKLAPYGAAAVQTLTHLGLLQTLQAKVVQGENISQTYQFVASENAQLGFVALSQIMVESRLAQGSAWVVPAHLHYPIRQDAIVLSKGRESDAAAAFMRFLRGEQARAVTRSFGYTF
jgi:molybdate transport system substrate-binding protein